MADDRIAQHIHCKNCGEVIDRGFNIGLCGRPDLRLKTCIKCIEKIGIATIEKKKSKK